MTAKAKALWIFLIIIVALSLRLVFLDRVPIAISGDEIDYVFTAKSVYLTGHDISGNWNPWSFTTPPLEVPKAELPYILLTPFIGPLSFSLLTARIPYVLSNLILIVTIVFLTARLINWKTGIVAGFLAAANPWFIYFSRTSFDSPVSATFMYLGLLMLVTQKSWKILLSFPFFAIGFYTYIGAKVVFLPFIFVALAGTYFLLNNKQYLKHYIVLGMLSVLLVTIFALSFSSQLSSSRTSDLVTPFSSHTSDHVDKYRKSSIVTPATPLFVNKFTVYIQNRVRVYAGFFSPQYLFLYGDERAPFSIWEYGVMHLIDALFLISGIVFILKKKKKIGIFLILLLAVSPLPSVLSGVSTTYSIRANLAFPLLVMFAAYGITSFATIFNKRKLVFYAVVAIVYCVSTSYFMYQYLYRNPIYNSESLNFSGRVVANYIHYAIEQDVPLVIFNDNETNLLRFYFFYYDMLSIDSYEDIKAVLTGQSNTYKNIVLANCDNDILIDDNTIVMTKSGGYCDNTLEDHNSIAQLSDGGEVYRIYNDVICTGYNILPYPYGLTMDDFAVEELSQEEFCEAFVTKLPVIEDEESDK